MHHIYKKKWFLLLSAPLLIFFTAFVIFPIVFSFILSFTSYRGLGEAVWNNFANYIRLFSDPYVGISIRNSLFAAAVMILIQMPLSFTFAYFLNQRTKRNEVYKVIVFAPYVIPAVLVGLVWTFILNPSYGLINTILAGIGLENFQPMWIGGVNLSPLSYAMAASWGSLGFYMSIWLMALKNLPNDTLEASLIDGCNKWQQLWRIIIPMLRENIVSIFILIMTSALKIYELVYTLTGGGPNHASETIVSYLYSTTFESMLYGYGMTIAVVEFVLALAVALLSLTLSKSKED